MSTQTLPGFDLAKVRADFPTLHQEVNGKPLVYFDNAATSQKPQLVIDRLDQYYARENSNVHRGVHTLSQQATDAYEHTRSLVQQMINAQHQHEIIYTKGTTEGINLIAFSFGQKYIKEGDEIIISTMEHHSNIVPWQLLCERTGAKLKVVPIFESGELDFEAYKNMLSEKTKLVSMVYISNSLGTINPMPEIIKLAHERDIPVLVDAAQVVPHMAVDVQELDADFMVFSGHKMFGPTGTGILYGKEKWLNDLPPWMGGGDMIKVVRFDHTTYSDLPHKFEAGTPNIAGAIGLGAGIEYINSIGYDAISAWEHELLAYGTEQLGTIPDIRFVGTAKEKASVISFLIGDIHPYDAGTILDQLGIAIRTGHHCTQPLMHHLQIPGTMRASFAFYNTKEEIDRLVEGIHRVKKMFG
ncbi:cysteine desulfurase [Pontibacter sp. G13]|uniref:aminotransferase class V-fold PLP-dependent enzyme n=1 Tax=Pontibacter sp. G13 TaxID=3074898 RepID=UPI00288C237B|nr:cysteine desulfurase [Pontibacter sp. G13]WNJ19551.1 cysteine desulfurase [Pontibacter sp. G13]